MIKYFPEEEFEKRKDEILESYFTQCIVHIIDKDHRDREVWDKFVEIERQRTIRENQNNNRLMKQLLSGEHELSKVFCGVYNIPDIHVETIPACGGCPQCRKHNFPLLDYPVPDANCIRNIDNDLNQTTIHSDLGHTVIVVYDPPDNTERAIKKWRKRILAFLKIIIPKYGIREIGVSTKWLEFKEYTNLYMVLPNRFLIHTDIDEKDDCNTLLVKRITVVDPSYPARALHNDLLILNRPFHMLVIQSDTPDYHSPRKLIDTFKHTTIDNVLKGLS